MSITIRRMIDSPRQQVALQPLNHRPQAASRLIPRWKHAPGPRLIPRWTRLAVAGTALAEYNPCFAENPYGRILPAHFFCLIAFFRLNTSHELTNTPRMNWQDATQRTVTGLGYELVGLDRSGG
ncbi:MAG: hypothetical protein E4H19_16400, partial [Chromatiales bacterium]